MSDLHNIIRRRYIPSPTSTFTLSGNAIPTHTHSHSLVVSQWILIHVKEFIRLMFWGWNHYYMHSGSYYICIVFPPLSLSPCFSFPSTLPLLPLLYDCISTLVFTLSFLTFILSFLCCSSPQIYCIAMSGWSVMCWLRLHRNWKEKNQRQRYFLYYSIIIIIIIINGGCIY